MSPGSDQAQIGIVPRHNRQPHQKNQRIIQENIEPPSRSLPPTVLKKQRHQGRLLLMNDSSQVDISGGSLLHAGCRTISYFS